MYVEGVAENKNREEPKNVRTYHNKSARRYVPLKHPS